MKNSQERPKNKITLNLYTLQWNLFKIEMWKAPVKCRAASSDPGTQLETLQGQRGQQAEHLGKTAKNILIFTK